MRATLASLAALALVAGPADAARPGLPPSEATARAALDASPRHGEYVAVPLPSGSPLRAFVVYPERPDRAGAVIVIHEIYGLSDWIRGVADRLAADGFIAIAPDLVSGLGPGGGGTDSVASRDEVVRLVTGLEPAAVRERLDATRAYVSRLPAANGKVATLGFCWGRVGAPVLGHYGGDDARVTSTVPAARAALRERFEEHVHPGAGHGFLRQQDGRDGANLRASRAAWPRTVAFLRAHLR